MYSNFLMFRVVKINVNNKYWGRILVEQKECFSFFVFLPPYGFDRVVNANYPIKRQLSCQPSYPAHPFSFPFYGSTFFPRKPKQLATKTETKSSTFLFDMRAVWVVYYKIENISRLCG